MTLYETINIIGITAYSLVAIFFLWLTQVPNSGTRAKFWFIAVLFMLVGRVNLHFMPQYIAQDHIQAIYAFSLTFEKIFLIIGLMQFVEGNKKKSINPNFLRFGISILLSLLILFYFLGAQTLTLSWFSTTQAIFLLIVAYTLKHNTFNKDIQYKSLLIVILYLYAVHWLTFPIAVNFPTWLNFGYLFGNALNLIVYLSFAYMVVNRFQNRMIQAEQSALSLVKEANQASKAKSDFLANMSHEIRTPMNGVISMLELLHHDNLSSEQHNRVSIALASGNNLLQVINDILDFSKIEAGKLSLEYIDFNIIEMLEEVVDIVKASAHSKGLELILDVADVSIVMVNSDPLRIKQILLNLISNAIKFTEQGEILIKANINEKHDKPLFNCAIIDSGVGIEDDKRDKIFQSFQQEDTSTTRNYGGTGLGLSISKHLCQLLNGKISVSSQKGVGSCFTIALPLNRCSDTTKQPSQPDLSNLRALIVDSSNTHLTVITKLLTMWGISVETAITAEQALSLCKQPLAFNFILLGDHLNGIHAESLNEQVKQLPNCQSLKIIQLLSTTDDNKVHALLSDNVDFVLTKPMYSSQLLKAITGFNKPFSEAPNNKQKIQTRENKDLPDWPNNTQILLVEDNRINQVVATQLLAHFNLTCDIASHGAEALAMLYASLKNNRPYQLILMDCQMPVMDGYVTTENIRKGKGGDAYKATPIIAMTAHAMAGDKEKCLAIGMNDYMTKPLAKDIILEKLIKWLNIT
ncbi:response regulator [Thalassotalea sp. M1531]|uniref:Sensory/regulatory protein RpfC n=1 Tax=Thalassotalea algicola TaxID=2716224 RepID=A0A7Y0L9R1_9GAMM|nr:response regulator [Thalassotalea algicola]NMP30218.1 response regulator [Thalassotalea algicola]